MATQIYGTAGSDNIDGTAGADDIFAGAGNDWINGWLGDDFLYGEAGDDVVWFDDVVVDNLTRPYGLIDGGSGYDLIDLSGIYPSYLVYDDSEQSISVGSQGFDFTRIEEIWLDDGNNSLFHDLGITAATSPLAVFMGYGNDYAALAGAITINGEQGNDTFFLSGVIGAGFVVNADVYGGTGSDTIRLNIGFDVDLTAGTAAAFDSLYRLDSIENVEAVAHTNDAYSSVVIGNAAANRMTVWHDTTVSANDIGVTFYGEGGTDTLIGSKGKDFLHGGGGADSLQGGGGNDLLYGDGGNDRLSGGAGNDNLQGGGGRDVLTGGGGADRFVFTTLLDSGTSALLADSITDFGRAQGDRIDLSAIDAVTGGTNNAFTFIGTGDFTGQAGQLRYSFDSAATTLIEVDVNGDRLVDMAIRLDGQIALVANDFVL